MDMDLRLWAMERAPRRAHAGPMNTNTNTANHITSDPVLVLGATGKTGRRVAAGLTAAGRRVRAASRSSATHLDWDDPSTWAPALEGAAALYLVPPPPGTADATALIEASEAAGVDHVVLLSARAHDQIGVDHLNRVEDAVRAGSIPWTILRPTSFAQNFSEGPYAPGIEAGTLTLPAGDGKEPFIDVDDVAAVAVAALTDPGRHEGRTYELSGPELMTFADAVDIVAGVSGRDVVFADVDPAAWADQMGPILPPAVIEVLTNLFGAIRRGESAHLSDGVEQALGRPATPFATWAERTFR